MPKVARNCNQRVVFLIRHWILVKVGFIVSDTKAWRWWRENRAYHLSSKHSSTAMPATAQLASLALPLSVY